MEVAHETAILVAETKGGKAKYWQGRVLKDGADYYTQTVWWQDHSAVQESTPAQVLGKNLGRRNETSPEAQAHAELSAEVKKLRDKKGYRYPGEAVAADAVVLPMLAEKFLEVDDVEYPCFTQPKLDGHRALYDGTRFTTRGGQVHKPHIQQALALSTKGLTFDGELMLDPACPALEGLSKVERFQLSASAVKADYPDLTPWLRFFVYDVVDDKPFAARDQVVWAFFKTAKAQQFGWRVVKTHPVEDEAAVLWTNAYYLGLGYEGTMVRHTTEGYRVGHRSRQLLKLKPYDDAEFEIVDVVPAGKGKAAKVGKFVCRTAEGVEFRANPKGSYELRQSYLENRTQLIGKRVTVYYEGFSDEGKPRFPRAINVREEGE